jgi:hypothetical protein
MEAFEEMMRTIPVKMGIIERNASDGAVQAAAQTASELTGQPLVPGELPDQELPQVDPEEDVPSGWEVAAPFVVGGVLIFGFLGVGLWLLLKDKD